MLKKDIKVLYVEDDNYVSEIMISLLSRFVVETIIAKNGEEGLELFKKENPDLIISDIVMPKMNGLDMTREILKIDANKKIILITADNESLYYKKADNIGVYGYLKKPIDFKELLSYINKF